MLASAATLFHTSPSGPPPGTEKEAWSDDETASSEYNADSLKPVPSAAKYATAVPPAIVAPPMSAVAFPAAAAVADRGQIRGGPAGPGARTAPAAVAEATEEEKPSAVLPNAALQVQLQMSGDEEGFMGH